jgi:glycosyltransferase involved in cell wall biosynthesis
LLNNLGLRRHLSENGRRLVQTRYNWATIGQDFDQFLQAVRSDNGTYWSK